MFIVTKEIDSENISKLCRTCLREDGEKMVCLFVGPAGSSLAAKLRSLSCLDVWQGDGLPEKMCDRCVTRAESALLYREQCRAADRALRQAALKVSGVTSYTTVSGCKLYQENEGFVPVHNSHKPLKCIECGAVFMSYQELCTHSRLHLPFPQENIPMQHMHIVESQNPYLNFNFGHFGNNMATENIQSTELSPLIRSNVMQMIPSNLENSSRPACALHCSLCNHTFTNRTQLMSHNIAHNAENIDISCDNENIEICENSNQIPQNVTYERPIHPVENTIENLTYQRSAVTENEQMQNLTFPEHLDLEGVEDSNSGRPENPAMSAAASIINSRCVTFPKEQNDRSVYQPCPTNGHFKLGSEATKKFGCHMCTKAFSQKSKLVAHQLAHSGQQPFKCTSCSKAYASKSKLNAHTRLHTKTDVHQCTLCDKIFPYPSYLQEHLKTHEKAKRSNDERNSEEAKKLQCSRCNKRFSLMKNLKAHEKFHSGKGLFRCDICDKQFSQNYNLKIHLLTHKSTGMHKCEYCPKSFLQKGNLVEHLRIHTKVKPFECKICGKRFAQSSHLKSHEASHTSIRQYQCRLCGKRFKLANHLKRHLSLHTGAKAYKCQQCNQLFSQPFSLTRHLKRHSEANT